ncbi:double-stranded RNA binding motif domain-containing protein [Acaryochloris marina]|uniref:double-stranded RNA binding motif domain-containing protein n=1 Tax=Acaryochloris marina TaxID=155978 RepID=UPI001BB098A6|nr:double-stranded RNA binding motif domain-containing protein [Acaryochloris marina]QUY45973.1 RNA-binding protein [Acaryochloris marina S15]
MRSQHSHNLTIQLTEDQLGFLAYVYPNEDLEDALIKVLERARKQAIRQAEKQIRVLYPGQDNEKTKEETPEKPVSQGDDGVENPIDERQELCQRQQISMPRYEFETIPEGFRCMVLAMGLEGVSEGQRRRCGLRKDCLAKLLQIKLSPEIPQSTSLKATLALP